MLVYTGKPKDDPPEKNQALRVVSDMTYGLKRHNVTFDNWFFSYELGQLLLKRNITMLGTIKKISQNFPSNLLVRRERRYIPQYLDLQLTLH